MASPVLDFGRLGVLQIIRAAGLTPWRQLCFLWCSLSFPGCDCAKVIGDTARDRQLLYLFEDFVLDTGQRELRRGPTVVSIAPQAFDFLEFLIRNRERVLTKDDLIA
jgi:DNA-binding response OmpR family regulator